MKKKNVYVIGTGTIGLPLIGMLNQYKEELGIDEVMFHKNTPSSSDIATVKRLVQEGATFTTHIDKFIDFGSLGVQPKYSQEEALGRASVVLDCTPKGVGRENKKRLYSNLPKGKKFIAQGSETGFGVPYAHGINDAVLKSQPEYVQVVSCNTHNICALVKAFDGLDVVEGNFVCLRRASDISQSGDFLAGIEVGVHKDEHYGTHHAKDASRVLETLRRVDSSAAVPKLFSSACILPTQYMHAIHFSLVVSDFYGTWSGTVQNVAEMFTRSSMVAVSNKRNSNTVFSFGRDHGYYGRILNQTVVSVPTLAIRELPNDKTEIIGFCFTPQDGNSLVSSVAAVLWQLHGNESEVNERLSCIRKHLFKEI